MRNLLDFRPWVERIQLVYPAQSTPPTRRINETEIVCLRPFRVRQHFNCGHDRVVPGSRKNIRRVTAKCLPCLTEIQERGHEVIDPEGVRLAGLLMPDVIDSKGSPKWTRSHIEPRSIV